MLLAIDVGNTQTVVGLYGDDELLDHWRIHTNAAFTSDEYALVIQEFLAFHGFSFDEDVQGMAVSSGVPRITAALREMAERYLRIPPVILGPGVKTGMPIMYEDPTAVGPDRIADAVAAFDLYGGPAIVVDFGTATVFDGVSAKGEYLGGAIVPGIEVSLDALFARTSLLRRVELVEPRTVIGRSTVDSIQSGILYGYSALVDGLVSRFEEELGDSTVVGTGGLVDVIAPYTARIEHVEPWLTLHGLRLVYEKNRP